MNECELCYNIVDTLYITRVRLTDHKACNDCITELRNIGEIE